MAAVRRAKTMGDDMGASPRVPLHQSVEAPEMPRPRTESGPRRVRRFGVYCVYGRTMRDPTLDLRDFVDFLMPVIGCAFPWQRPTADARTQSWTFEGAYVLLSFGRSFTHLLDRLRHATSAAGARRLRLASNSNAWSATPLHRPRRTRRTGCLPEPSGKQAVAATSDQQIRLLIQTHARWRPPVRARARSPTTARRRLTPTAKSSWCTRSLT